MLFQHNNCSLITSHRKVVRVAPSKLGQTSYSSKHLGQHGRKAFCVSCVAGTFSADVSSGLGPNYGELPALDRTLAQVRPEGWAKEQLSNLLVGLIHSTKRVKVVTTRVVQVLDTIHTSQYNGKPQCGSLYVDMEFETVPSNLSMEAPRRGTARVKLATEDHCDVVQVEDVKMLDAQPSPDALSDSVAAMLAQDASQVVPGVAAPSAGKPCIRQEDIVYAVQSLDSAIMDKLNSFLWNVEEASMA